MPANSDTTMPPVPVAASRLFHRLGTIQQRKLAEERAHTAAQIAQLEHALVSVKLAIEATAPDVVWMQTACPETACDFITRTLESINDVAY